MQCKCTYHDRYLAHELVNGVYNLFAKEAGATTVVNPSTDAMMMSKLGDARSRLLFPGNNAQAEEMRNRLDTLTTILASQQTKDDIYRTRAAINTLLESVPNALAGLIDKVDLIATFPSDVLWIDVGIVHPTASSYLP